MVRALSSDTVVYRVPDHLRHSNPQLSKFLQYYYAWAEQQGNSLDLLNNLIQYKDIDTATEFFANLTLKQFLKMFPETVQIDKKILVKNIREFFVAKGTVPSFEFLMNALFSEKVSLDWQSKYVFRASDNEYVKNALIAVEIVSGDFNNIVGSKIEQTLPYKAMGYCISVEFDTVNGKSICIVGMDPQKLTNSFNIGSVVKILKNTVDRNNAQESDYAYGVVLPCLANVEITSPGAIYSPGDKISFIDGNGVYANATINSVGLGKVSSIRIEDGGSGYEVGDKISTISASTFDATVSKVDGYGAEFDVSMEVNAVIKQSGGYGYAVGDILEAENAGIRDYSEYPLRIEVTGVDSSWALQNIRIDDPGISYKYKNVVLYDNVGDSIIAGFACTVFSDGKEPVHAVKGWDGSLWNGSISDILITAFPTITSGNVQVKINGFNATATANLSGGAINTVTVNTQGWNYVDPIVEVTGDGVGAILYPTVVAGRVTAITVARGGEGYTTATVTIKERFGYGFSATALLNNTTSSTGEVTTFTITNTGKYVDQLNAYGVTFRSISGSGFGFLADLDFRIKTANLVTAGGNYTDLYINTSSGRGSGADFRVTLNAGSVESIEVVSGGSNYPSNAEVIYKSSAGTNASLETIMSNGVIKQVNVISGGTGYSLQTLNLLQETGDELLQETGQFLAFDSQYDNIYVSCGSNAIISADLVDDGIVSAVKVVNSGKGCKGLSEVTPIKIEVNSVVGNCAILKPILENGSIIAVHVLHPGHDYSGSDTITVMGTGSGAQLVPTILNGQVTSVYVANGGSGYQYGTYPYVFGDGKDAEVTIEVNTGISTVEIVNGGIHSSVPSLTVNDPTGSGASLKAIVTNGTITDIIIETAGINYTNPTITVGSGSGTSLVAYANREVKSANVLKIGTGYDTANIEVLGDYEVQPKLECTVQRLHSSVSNMQVVHKGSGYTSLPILVTEDHSGKGAISEITISNSDSEFSRLPLLSIDSDFGIGAKVFAISTDIGKVTSVKFIDVGVDYSEIPKISFSTNVLVAKDKPFIKSEYLKSKSIVHLTDSDIIGTILSEGSDMLTTEGNDRLSLNLNDIFAKPYLGKLNRFNWEQNIMRIDEISDAYLISTEYGDVIVTEDGLVVEDQRSEKLNPGDTIYGVNSSAETNVLYAFQASGLSKTTGSTFYNFGFKDNSSKPNEPLIKIHNNERFQDFAYVLKCGLTLDQYESFIKEVVHPAGYKMFGDVDMIVKTITDPPSTPSTEEAGEELSISVIFDPVLVEYAEYMMVEPLKFKYQDTPISVFSDFAIRDLGHSFNRPMLNERIFIGRQELQADITP